MIENQAFRKRHINPVEYFVLHSRHSIREPAGLVEEIIFFWILRLMALIIINNEYRRDIEEF